MSEQNESKRRHPWKHSVFDLRETVTEVVASIPTQYPIDRMLGASQAHDRLHRYLMEYRAMLRPQRDKITVSDDDMHPWDKPIGAIDLPKRHQTVSVDRQDGLRDDMGDIELIQLVRGDLNSEEQTITLNNMADVFNGRRVSVTVEGWAANSGRIQKTATRPVWMPVRLCRRARDMLDGCLTEYGWLPEIETPAQDAYARAADVSPRLGPEDTMPALIDNGQDEGD